MSTGVAVGATLLVLFSLIVQGFIPVGQAGLKSNGFRESALATTTISVIGAVSFTLFILLLPGLKIRGPKEVTSQLIALVVLAAFLYAVANLLIFHASPIVGSIVFGMIFTMKILPTAVLSRVFLHESFGLLKVSGLVAIIGGIIWTLRMRRNPKGVSEKERPAVKQHGRAVVEVFIATIAFGSASACDAKVVKTYDTVSYIPVRLLLPVVFITFGLLVIGVRPRDVQGYLTKERRKLLLPIAVGVAAAASTLLFAIQISHQATTLNAIFQLSLFVTIAVGARLTKGDTGRFRVYLFPAVLCVVGVILTLVG